MQSFKNSPLWLIAVFISVAEAAAGFSVAKTDGNVQVAMLVFFICYTLLITLGFFGFLWFKPANFYAPSEYGAVPPAEYARALAGFPKDTADAVEAALENPLDEEHLFKLMGSLLPEEIKQHLILVHKNNGELDLPEVDENGFTHHYEIITRGHGISSGLFQPHTFLHRLSGTNLVTVSSSGRKIFLTKRGQVFTSWLLKHELDAETFNSEVGRWGKEQSARDIMKKYSK